MVGDVGPFAGLDILGSVGTTSRLCFPNVATVPGKLCYPIGSAGYPTNAGGHSAVISFTGPTPAVDISSRSLARSFKSAWVSNPRGAVAFRGTGMGKIQCSGVIPRSSGAPVDLKAAGCCGITRLTLGYVNGVTPPGTPFSLSEVRPC